MKQSEVIEQVVTLLGSVTKMVSVLAIGQRLAEASSESERIFLSRSLLVLLEKDNGFRIPEFEETGDQEIDS